MDITITPNINEVTATPEVTVVSVQPGVPQTSLTVPLLTTLSSTYSTLQDLQNTVNSAGQLSGGVVTDDTDGTISVSAGTGLIRSTDDHLGDLLFTDWPAESGANVALLNLQQNYIYIDYNSGTSQVFASTVIPPNEHTKILLANIYKDGTTLHINDEVLRTAADHMGHANERLIETQPYARVDGGVISETGVRNIAVSAGNWWHGLNNFTTGAFDSSVADTFTYYWLGDGAGAWNKTAGVTQIDNTQYDDGTDVLASLGGIGKYGVHWVYLESDGDVAVIYGTDAYSLSPANDADAPTSLPPEIEGHGWLVGKIIIQHGDATFTSIATVFDTTFTYSPATDHENLTGLLGGAASDHQHLTTAELTGTTTQKGLVRLSTTAESVALSLATVAVTPAGLAAVFASPPAIGSTAAAAGTFTTLIATGAFTSLGIDDNATGERLQLSDTELVLGTASAPYVIRHQQADQGIYLSGGSTASNGANLRMWGGSTAGLAGDIQFNSGSTTTLYYDDSASSWDFQANALITTGTLVAGDTTITGTIQANDAAGPAMLNEAASSINPTLIPNKADPDSGRGWVSANVLADICGGTQITQLTSNKFTVLNKAEVRGGSAIAFLVGSDLDSTITVTDATTKRARMAIPHYTNAEEPMALVYGESGSGNGTLSIGGGYSAANAATEVAIYAAANNTTVTGTKVGSFDINGFDVIGAFTAGATTISGTLALSNAAGPSLLNEAASATNPTLIPDRGHATTGIGYIANDTVALIGAGSLYASTGGGKFVAYFSTEIRGGSGLSLLVGSDAGGNTVTDATTKRARIGTPHYTNAEESATLIYAQNTATANQILFGGGAGTLNAATTIELYAAANNTTVTGTKIAEFDISGLTLQSGADLNLAGGRVSITDTANEAALSVVSSAITSNALNITASSLTSARIAYLYSNSASTGLRNLVEIVNDNVLATGATVLKLQNDSTGLALDAIGDISVDGHVIITDDKYLGKDTNSRLLNDTTSGITLMGVGAVNFIIDSNNSGTDTAFRWGMDATTYASATALMSLNELGNLVLNDGTLTLSEGSATITTTNTEVGLTVNGGSAGLPVAIFKRNVGANTEVRIGGASGDPQIQFDDITGTQWGLGKRASDDNFVIATSAAAANDGITGGTSRFEITQTGNAILTGGSLSITDTANENALLVTSSATTAEAVRITASSLTTGKAFSIYSNSAATDSRLLAAIVNDNVAAVGTTALKIQQDAANVALLILAPAGSNAVELVTGDLEVTAGDILMPKTSGSGILIGTSAANDYGWDDITGDIIAKGVGANNPTWTQVATSGIFNYAFSVNDEVWINFHVPHDYAPGTDIFVHTHWMVDGTDVNTVKWEFSTLIAKGHNQDNYPTTATVNTATEAPQGTAWRHMETETSAISSTDLEPDTIIQMRVRRVTNAGTDNTDTVFLLETDIHYQSTGIKTKNNTPNFYT